MLMIIMVQVHMSLGKKLSQTTEIQKNNKPLQILCKDVKVHFLMNTHKEMWKVPITFLTASMGIRIYNLKNWLDTSQHIWNMQSNLEWIRKVEIFFVVKTVTTKSIKELSEILVVVSNKPFKSQTWTGHMRSQSKYRSKNLIYYHILGSGHQVQRLDEWISQ